MAFFTTDSESYCNPGLAQRGWRRHESMQVALEAACFCVVGLWCSLQFGLADGSRITLALAVAYALPRGVLSQSSGRGRMASFVLMAVGMLMVLSAVSGLWHCTIGRGGGLPFPKLRSDDAGYYWWAVHSYVGDNVAATQRIPFIGFPLLILASFHVMGVSVLWPIAINMMMTLLAIVVTASTAVRVLHGRVEVSAGTIAAMVIGGCGTLFYFLSQGVAVQKEASNYLAISLVAYGLARMCTEGRLRVPLWRDVLIFALGSVLLSMTRLTMSYFSLAGIAVSMLISPRRNWRYALVLTVVAVGAFALGMGMTYDYGFDRQARIVAGAGAMDHLYIRGISQEPYRAIIGDYFSYTVPHRLLLLPVTGAVQAIIPFPWFIGNLPSSAGDVLPRLGWTWYALLGIAIYYYIFLSFRRGGNGLGLWALWPLMCFLGVAYVTGGSLNRYVLPFEPLMMIVATYVVLSVRERHARASLTRWLVAYGLVLAAVLLVCYNMQSNYYYNPQPAKTEISTNK